MLLAAVTLWVTGQAAAHEIRPGYLELREIAPTSFSVVWKVPMRDGARLRLEPVFPETCRQQTTPTSREVGGGCLLCATDMAR